MEGFSITKLDPPDSRKSNYRRGINATNKRIEYLYTEGCIAKSTIPRITEKWNPCTKTRVAPIQRLNRLLVRTVNDSINSWKCHSSLFNVSERKALIL